MLAGVAFTESCKPVFSVHLKSQLDQYLSTQPSSSSSDATVLVQESTVASGRTLGSSKQIQQHRTRTRKCTRVYWSQLHCLYMILAGGPAAADCLVV